jgi:hypothetical protein
MFFHPDPKWGARGREAGRLRMIGPKSLGKMTDEELVRAYEDVVVKQDESFKYARNAAFNDQYLERQAVADELRSRPGDQRAMLASLFKSRMPWVRICVAQDTLSLNEARARMHMEYIGEHARAPYKGHALSALSCWDRGHRPK